MYIHVQKDQMIIHEEAFFLCLSHYCQEQNACKAEMIGTYSNYVLKACHAFRRVTTTRPYLLFYALLSL